MNVEYKHFFKINRIYFFGLIFLLLLLTPLQAFGQAKQEGANASTSAGITVLFNGQPVVFEEPPILEEGRLFVPARYVTDHFGATLEWNNDTREIVIVTAHGERLVYGADNPYMTFNEKTYFMGIVPFIKDSKIYLPIRHAAEFLHMDVSWDAESQTASFVDIALHTVSAAESPEMLAEIYDVPVELLIERNGLKQSTDIKANVSLKVVIPEIMADKIDPKAYFAAKEKEEAEAKAKAEEAARAKAEAEAKAAAKAREEEKYQQDLTLLAKLVQVESGAESYAGQLAVANVVLNRVNDKHFPNTIKGVIYAPKQFPPAHNGLLDRAKPGKNAWKAAEAALGGENNVKGALYFYNPKVTSGSFWNSLTLIKEIGTHRFMGR